MLTKNKKLGIVLLICINLRSSILGLFDLFKNQILKSFAYILLICSFTSMFALDAIQFYQRINEPAPAWMKEQIKKDLDPFTKELSHKFLDEFFEKWGKQFYLVRLRMQDGILYIEKKCPSDHSVPDLIVDGIRKLHALAPLPDFDLLFSAHDSCVGTYNPPLPIFTESKDKKSNCFILLPDRFALHDYQPQKDQVLQGNLLYPWEAKEKILFFRGSDTGAPHDFENWKNYPRPKLVFLSLEHPDLIDARFADYLHFREMVETARSEGLIGTFVSMSEHPRYRYLVDVDGNCAACPRTATLFFSNSVSFKQMTDSIQWFYGTIHPYKHFIPYNEDLSNLITQIKWAKNNDDACRAISQNAMFFAQEVLTEERIYQYLYHLLHEYAKRQKLQYNEE